MTNVDVLDAVTVIALTLFGEARGEGPEGRIAVANVIRNRVGAQRDSFGRTLRAVCLKPLQFSCWTPLGGEANHGVLSDMAAILQQPNPPIGPLLRECMWIADGLMREQFADNTKGATHYLTSALYTSKPPSWAVNQRVLAAVGSHVFLRVA